MQRGQANQFQYFATSEVHQPKVIIRSWPTMEGKKMMEDDDDKEDRNDDGGKDHEN